MDVPGGVALGFRSYDNDHSMHVTYDPSATEVTALVRRKGQRVIDDDGNEGLACVEASGIGVVPATDADGNPDPTQECVLSRDLTVMVD